MQHYIQQAMYHDPSGREVLLRVNKGETQTGDISSVLILIQLWLRASSLPRRVKMKVKRQRLSAASLSQTVILSHLHANVLDNRPLHRACPIHLSPHPVKSRAARHNTCSADLVKSLQPHLLPNLPVTQSGQLHRLRLNQRYQLSRRS